MKIIRIIFFSLLALGLIISLGVFIFFQTFDIDRYLPQLAQKASLAIGRPVSIAGMGLGLSELGITLDAGPVIIADDTAFTSQPFIKVDKLRLSLDLGSLIFQHKIQITEIFLQSPQIHFIRSQEGNINVRSIGQASRSAVPDIGHSQQLAISQRTNAPRSSSSSYRTLADARRTLPDGRNDTIIINSIRIQDGSISFIDQNQNLPLDIWLLKINLNLKDFSMSKPFQLSFNASPLLLKGISPGTSDSPVFKDITGVVQLNMAHLENGVAGDIEGNGAVNVTGGVIKDFNIIKTVLPHTLGVFGGMEINIDRLLNGQLKSKLGAADTVIKKAEAQFSFHNKTVFIDNFLIETDIFEFTAKGSLDQGLNMDMQTMLHLNKDVSAALVNELDGFKFLFDDSKRIAIGAGLKGVIPHLKYKPDKDFRKKSKKALIEEGGNILGILLGGGPTSIQVQDTAVQEPGKDHKKNFKNIFKSLLQ